MVPCPVGIARPAYRVVSCCSNLTCKRRAALSRASPPPAAWSVHMCLTACTSSLSRFCLFSFASENSSSSRLRCLFFMPAAALFLPCCLAPWLLLLNFWQCSLAARLSAPVVLCCSSERAYLPTVSTSEDCPLSAFPFSTFLPLLPLQLDENCYWVAGSLPFHRSCGS